MARKKGIALILVMAVLLGMALSGCGVIEFQIDKWEMRQKASKLALPCGYAAVYLVAMILREGFYSF